MTDWRATSLGEICRFQAGDAFPKELQGAATGDVPVVKVSDMNLSGNELFISCANNWLSTPEVKRDFKLHPAGAVVFAKIGVALTSNRRRILLRPTVIDNNMMSAVCTSDVDPRWFYYLLTTLDFNEVASGSALPYLTVRDLNKIAVSVPPLPEQSAIAATLGALDDKIELNRKMNATLEAMARALFRDWFVDFGPTRAKMEGRAPTLSPDLWSLFPDRLDDEGKPEGWEVSSIASLTRRITKGTTPTNLQMTAAPDAASINFLRVNNLSDDGKLLLGNTVQIAQSVHEGALKRSMLQQDDLLYSIAGTIGRVTKTPQEVLPANVNQAIAIIRANPELAPPNYLLMWLSDADFQNELHSNIVQAVQANLSLGMLSDARILAPPRETLTNLFRPIDALLESTAHNERESRTLAQTRDLLLPRLMSGELRVADLAPSEKETAA